MHGPIAIILAAGQGTRMKSRRAKVLHEVCGRPMLSYVIEAARAAGARSIVVVAGYGVDEVRAAVAGQDDVQIALQAERKGTGHAVKMARELLKGYAGPLLVLVGDAPLLRPEPLAMLLERQASEKAACLLGTATVADPAGFGRILRDSAGHFLRIIEQRDCDADEARIREVNPSCYVFEAPLIWDVLERLLPKNAQSEEYLTDAPAILQDLGFRVVALPALDAQDILGVNTQEHLSQAHAILQQRIQTRLMDEGVTIVDPSSTYIDSRAVIGVETEILPFTVIQGRVSIGQGCRIGPFTHLRDGTVVDDGVELGAFVEVSNSHLHPQVRARHLAYLGNAEVGSRTNIGAGVITANFDGHDKQPTTIGPEASLGAGSILIAPVEIGARAIVGAGAVLTKYSQVPAGQTVAGVPARPLPGKAPEAPAAGTASLD